MCCIEMEIIYKIVAALGHVNLAEDFISLSALKINDTRTNLFQL